jgi:dihydroorotase
MSTTLKLVGGELLDGRFGRRKADIGIRDGRFVAPDELPADTASRDLSGLVLAAPLFDLAARLREPGATRKGSLASELAAAVRGGFGHVALLPDTEPCMDTTAAVHWVQKRVAELGLCEVSIWGALSKNLAGEQLAEMAGLQAAGVVGLSQAGQPIADLRLLRNALRYAAGLKLRVHLPPLHLALADQGVAHGGAVATRMGLAAMPRAAETVALAMLLELVRDTGVAVHFGRLSCARSVDLLARAQQDGLTVTADVAMHQLHLSEIDMAHFDTRFRLNPPLRAQSDRDGLLEGVRTGVIGAIVSDHQPHEPDAKLQPFGMAEVGLSTFETTLGLGLRLVEQANVASRFAPALSHLSELELWQRLSHTPAAILQQPEPVIAAGAPANALLLDRNGLTRCSPEHFVSAGKHSPFAGSVFGYALTGRVVAGKWLEEAVAT